ncbi:MAG: HAD-IIB family hydrolase [Chromatiales bacterium]|jgi:sucrose-phosphate synthase|nr:HAD-IIB family hydrolase [Chromatiales bacterium]
MSSAENFGNFGSGLYIVLISVHGLIRGHDLELGRDADTGGQVLYVVELLRALAAHPAVERVDLLTRCIVESRLPGYDEPMEEVAPGANIVRIACGPRRYLRKEALWPHLDSFADRALRYLRSLSRLPDLIHAHYADAGYVGVRLSSLLEAPLVFTGHSLGHVKRERLLEKGVSTDVIESQYRMTARIEAENQALDNAAFIVASTHQEVEVQYSRYDNYQPKRMVVIPPGVDLQRFHPPLRGEARPPIYSELCRFLRHPEKPMILALSRPDPRKNLPALIHAYAQHKKLRDLANLVLITGNRDDVMAMEKGPRRTLTELMQLIDHYDLYGNIAYPKHHQPGDVPDLYRLAARSRGLFVNPALTEPFGLTLLEAAASGLPVIATNDGGPQDIIAYCRNGLLVDPLDIDALGEAMCSVLSDRARWQHWSKAGIAGAKRHFSWEGHVRGYLREVHKVMAGSRRRQRGANAARSRLPSADRILVCDVDNTLIGDRNGLDQLMQVMRDTPARLGFGVATGRHLQAALKVLKQWRVPMPDFIISAAGSEIHYGPKLVEDEGWKRHIDHRFEPDRVLTAMQGVRGVRMQPADEQRRFKISYFLDAGSCDHGVMLEIVRRLRRADIHVNVICSYQKYLDLLPVRASKGAALRHIADKWGVPIDRVLAAGDAGNDEEMLSGETLGVVVANYSAELERLRGRDRIYFAQAPYALGILEGIRHYDFLGRPRSREPSTQALVTA